MTKKYISFGLFMAIILLTGCIQEQPVEQNDSNVADSADYTIDDISSHNSGSDCWTVINGKVYDITNATSPHPGGEAILQGCGIDATVLFETRPMGSGTPHSQNAYDWLENYYIGDLEE